MMPSSRVMREKPDMSSTRIASVLRKRVSMRASTTARSSLLAAARRSSSSAVNSL